MTTHTSDDAGGCLTAIVAVMAIPGVFALMLLGLVFETWVALKLWAWFAPWAMPLTLVQAVGLNIAVSLVVRQSKQGKDERSVGEHFAEAMAHSFAVPALALASGWVLLWWR